MPIFRYEVTDPSGKILRGAMDAIAPGEVEARLRERGYRDIHILPAPHVGTAASGGMPIGASVPRPTGFVFGGVKPADLATFYRQMASLMHSGFTVGSAMGDLGQRSGPTALRDAATAMATQVSNGVSLAEAMAKYPAIFPHHLVGLAAAGEQGGFLEFAFEESALWAEQEAALQQGNWVNQVLIWQSVWSVLIMAPLFPSIDISAIDNVGTFLSNSFLRYVRTFLLICLPIGLGLQALQFFLRWLKRQPSWSGFFDRLTLRFPVFARYARMQALAAFTRVLRRLLISGIAPEIAYIGAANAVPNSVLREQLLGGSHLLRNGQGLDTALQSTGLMEDDPLNLLITGQKTGQWQEMLEKVTSYYQEEVARAIEAVKATQRRYGWLLTILSFGYVTIALAHGLGNLGLRLYDDFTKN